MSNFVPRIWPAQVDPCTWVVLLSGIAASSEQGNTVEKRRLWGAHLLSYKKNDKLYFRKWLLPLQLLIENPLPPHCSLLPSQVVTSLLF